MRDQATRVRYICAAKYPLISMPTQISRSFGRVQAIGLPPWSFDGQWLHEDRLAIGVSLPS
jgi:hypothetical protein